MLRTVGLTLVEWGYVLAFAFIIIPLDLARKFLRNLFFGNPVVQENSWTQKKEDDWAIHLILDFAL